MTAICAACIACSLAVAEDIQHSSEPAADVAFSSPTREVFPREVYFGDTHVHTSYSADAGIVGDRLGLDEAYRFAKGQVVTSSLGVNARLRRPLDFLVIADHAESLGIAPLIRESDQRILDDPLGREIYDLVNEGDYASAFRVFAGAQAKTGIPPFHRDDVRRTMWDRNVTAAETHYDPGRFTTLIGYEFTSNIQASNLHRVVIFRDGAERAGSIIPFSAVESSNPEDLWKFLDAYEKNTGGKALAIPHNGNLSNGGMFATETLDGVPIDRDYAQRRQRWEPLYEVTQIKGDGETHPLLSPDDEFADYWRWDRGNFGFEQKTPEMLPHEYARAALKLGLKFETELAINPFKFGLIGSTDAHTSLSTTSEDNFFSKATPTEPGSGQNRYDYAYVPKYDDRDFDIRVFSFETTASGLAAVWATENTREAIFDAMQRKEVYATTGTRIRLRFFGGFDFDEDDAAAPDTAAIGYDKGVPMGRDLRPNNEPRQAPTFLTHARRDPDGANLDRIQIVKGWLQDGTLKEKVHNVAWAGGPSRENNGTLGPISSSVVGAHYSNVVGAPELSAVWRDDDFDPDEPSFYYVRVLEIPTPTWLAYDKEKYGDAISLPDTAVLSHQERAYSSPIWYTPANDVKQ